MTKNEEEVIIEQLFSSINLDVQGRNFYLSLLLGSKELEDSEYNYTDDSPSRYDIVYMHLNNEGSIIRFDGSISNGEENKLVYGAIIGRGNKYTVHIDFYRLFDLVFGKDKEYTTIEEFRFKNNSCLRKTKYMDDRYFEADVTLKTEEEVQDYLRKRVGIKPKEMELK